MEIFNYIERLLVDDSPLLDAVQSAGDRRDAPPTIGRQAGKLLGLLVRLSGARRVLELGTSGGYGTIWLGEALRTVGGRLWSVELDEQALAEARRHIAQAKLGSIVELLHGDAAQVVETLAGPFDMIVQDSKKALYPQLLSRCIELTRVGGLIVADDALFVPMGVSEKFAAPIHQYNEMIFADARLYSTILPIGDGVALSLKLRD
ncbi:MAG TPA: O-methyltransferase [bacterium]|nr:O-methyltransferase [bacterium]